MSEEDLNTYKKYVSDLDITKYIVLDTKSNYWYSAEYVDKMLKEQDKEIERLNNIINESADEILKELEENHHLSYGVALAIRQKLLDYKEIRGSDKE